MARTARGRETQLKVMVSEEEKGWLEEIASSRGLTSSDVVRLAIRDAYVALPNRDAKPKRRRKT